MQRRYKNIFKIKLVKSFAYRIKYQRMVLTFIKYDYLVKIKFNLVIFIQMTKLNLILTKIIYIIQLGYFCECDEVEFEMRQLK